MGVGRAVSRRRFLGATGAVAVTASGAIGLGLAHAEAVSLNLPSALPEGTPWTALHVTGMKCGGCAKKIESALAKIEGVKGVKIDWQAGKVEVAVAEGKDARTLAKPVVDSLGYHVD